MDLKLSAADLEERLNEFGIPNGKIYRPPVTNRSQFQARDSIVRVFTEFGNIAMQNVTPRLSKSRARAPSGAGARRT